MATIKALADTAAKSTNGNGHTAAKPTTGLDIPAGEILKENGLPEKPKEKIPVPAVIEKTPSQSIEDRFFKMDLLLAKRERWERLKYSLDKLNKFKNSSDSNTDHITLTDGKGNSFATSNPKVLKQVIEWLKNDIASQLAETDNEIKF